MPRYASQQKVAEIYDTSDRTVRHWVEEGWVTGYRLPGPSWAVHLDLDEVEQARRTNPRMQKRRTFGNKAKIVDLRRQGTVMDDGAVER